jgi:phospholipase C
VNLANADANTVTVMVADNSYGAATVAKTLAPGQKRSVLLDLHRSHGWYDFTVKAEGVESAAHFAGRVETGRSSFTDPLMGRVKFA